MKSLAVLPFVNVSEGEGSQYFADGMQDALIAELAQIGSLRVISRTSSMQYLLASIIHRSSIQDRDRAFRRASDLEPGYARAWSGMADCFGAMAVQSMLPPKEGASEAKPAAEKALALDPSLAEAHTSMAGIRLFFEWNWASAERALRSDLDPMSPVANVDLAWAYLLMRDCPKALEQCLSLLDMKVNFPLARVYLGQVYQCMGKHEAAIEETEKALPSDGDGSAPILAMLGYAYGLAGRSEAARDVLRRMDELAKRRYVSPYDRAVLHTGLREKHEALRCLRQALTERSPRVIWLNVEPRSRLPAAKVGIATPEVTVSFLEFPTDSSSQRQDEAASLGLPPTASRLGREVPCRPRHGAPRSVSGTCSRVATTWTHSRFAESAVSLL